MLDYLNQNLYLALQNIDFSNLTEIRLRVNQPIILKYFNKEQLINFIPTKDDLIQSLDIMSEFSLYSHEEEIRNGYLSLPHGHRVGICGRAVYNGESISTVTDISSLNIRIANEIFGAGDKIVDFLDKEPANILIISPPACGKTTVLRDMTRTFSNLGHTVGLVDERGEVSGTYLGVSQNDVGRRTDILASCSKYDGVSILVRTMAPDIIALDEIGSPRDVEAMEIALTSGVKLFCTIHARSIDDLYLKPKIKSILSDKVFDFYVVLEGLGKIKAIYDKNLREVG